MKLNIARMEILIKPNFRYFSLKDKANDGAPSCLMRLLPVYRQT